SARAHLAVGCARLVGARARLGGAVRGLARTRTEAKPDDPRFRVRPRSRRHVGRALSSGHAVTVAERDSVRLGGGPGHARFRRFVRSLRSAGTPRRGGGRCAMTSARPAPPFRAGAPPLLSGWRPAAPP